MPDNTRRITLLFLALLILSVTLISAGLPQMDLQPGQPLPSAGSEGTKAAPEKIPPAAAVTTPVFFKATIGFLFVLFIPLLVYGLVKQSPWRRMLRYMALATLFTAIALSLLVLLASPYGAAVSQPPNPVTISSKPPIATTPLGSPPPWLIWLVFSGLALLVGGLGLWVIFTVTHRADEKNRVAEEAEKAVDALKSGLDLKNVIMHCYLQMSLALQEEQGIERKEAMTTREFERLLEARGIPHDPVHNLTRLFEAVRYGRRQVDPGDEQTAFDCLNSIIQYSRAKEQPR